MSVLSLIAQKGGAGKTTICVHLATALTQWGLACTILDLDPQSSALRWYDERGVPPSAFAATANRLPHLLDTARAAGMDIILIDTAPHSERTALAAARASDLVLVPCRPSLVDLWALQSTIDLCRIAGADSRALLNGVLPRSPARDEAAAAIQATGLAVLPLALGQRVAFAHAYRDSQGITEYAPQSKAATEIRQLQTWVCDHLSLAG